VILCPVCSALMSPTRSHNKPRAFCSKPCASRANGNVIRTRNADLDEVAVIRLISGSPVASTKAERREATRLLTARGRSASWIAEHVHITERSVTRYRAELHRREVAA
jgi:hypothetical protein